MMSNEMLLTVIALLAMIAVGVWALKSLKPDDHIKVADRQLQEARVKLLQHRALSEEHKAMSECYEVRVRRLDPQTAIPQDTQFGALS